MTTDEEWHLDGDEMDAALDFKLSDARAEHLARCQGCQYSVQWKRLARLGQLWTREHDWYSRTMEALTERAKARGTAFVFFVSDYDKFVCRSTLPFQKKPVRKTR